MGPFPVPRERGRFCIRIECPGRAAYNQEELNAYPRRVFLYYEVRLMKHGKTGTGRHDAKICAQRLILLATIFRSAE
jgi:hypothetical protein